MKRLIKLSRFLLILPLFSFAQQAKDSLPNPFPESDSLYREDQFYLGITYNRLLSTPEGYAQNGLATGFHAGFLRDMPVNKARTTALALGVGISWNKYHHNMLVTEAGGARSYAFLDEVNYDRNKLEELFVEAPFEFRFRTSTPKTTQFFRVYAGFKVRYLVFSKSTFDGATKITVFGNPDLEKLQYGPTLSIGYNTWNFHLYYALTPVFASGMVEGKKLDMRTLNLGLIFYIL